MVKESARGFKFKRVQNGARRFKIGGFTRIFKGSKIQERTHFIYQGILE